MTDRLRIGRVVLERRDQILRSVDAATHRAAAFARGRAGGRWMGRPSATSAASLTASASVGWAAIESAMVSIVASARDPDHARVDELGRLDAHDDEAEELAVARLVNGLRKPGPLAVHLRATRRGHRELADDDVVSVRLPSLGLGQADRRHLGIGVDAARHGGVVHRRLVPERVLGRDLALAERRVRELVDARRVADGVDMAHVGAHVPVGDDAAARVVLHARAPRGRCRAPAGRGRSPRGRDRPRRSRRSRPCPRSAAWPPRRNPRSGWRASPGGRRSCAS